jgi:predicted acyltransferase
MTDGSALRGKTFERYLSLDVLRGLTIALMVIVNSPGTWEHIYGPFMHAPWHGFTITDMVFPSFLFVVGNAMSFSMKKLESEPDRVFLKKVFKRTLLIYLIGLFLNAYPFIKYADNGSFTSVDLTGVRIYGVLQRIALCYCIASLVLYYLGTRGAIIFSSVALFAYWGLMHFFGDAADPYSLSGNAVLKLDLWLIGPRNIYKGEGVPFDPEGLLSTVPAVVNVIGGYLAGHYIQKNGNSRETVRRLIYVGFVLIALALVWDSFFPINKKIWTSSYVLLTVGLNTWAIAALMLIIELANVRKWTYFFEVFGRNPLVLYALSGMIVKTMALIRVDGMGLKPWIFNNVFMVLATPKNASLLYAIAYMMLIWLIGYWMDKKRIYVKV